MSSQDTNLIQFAILAWVGKSEAKLTAVGDEQASTGSANQTRTGKRPPLRWKRVQGSGCVSRPFSAHKLGLWGVDRDDRPCLRQSPGLDCVLAIGAEP
jgi:hypothetical protein